MVLDITRRHDGLVSFNQGVGSSNLPRLTMNLTRNRQDFSQSEVKLVNNDVPFPLVKLLTNIKDEI